MQAPTPPDQPQVDRRSGPIPLATSYGTFHVSCFQLTSGRTYLTLVRGELDDTDDVLVRLHSACLTGDTLGSSRCDCGAQLDVSIRRLAAEGRGILVYAVDDEGRGIGIVDKIRAYGLQDLGHDTVDANIRLGRSVDGRNFHEAAEVLRVLGVRSVRLLTNNPAKVEAVRAAGIGVHEVIGLTTSPNHRSLGYLRSKRDRLGHEPLGAEPALEPSPAIDVSEIVGEPDGRRPYVVLKFAQTIDGRTATTSGDSRWISSSDERALTHAIRAWGDAICVGLGTVLADDPQLTVRLVPGPSPVRVIFDSRLSIPDEARVLGEGPATMLFTSDRSDPARRRALVERGVGVHVVPTHPDGVDLAVALDTMRELGLATVVVEGGARIGTSLLAAGLVDRIIVSIAPTLLGAGRDAVGDLGIDRVAAALRLEDPVVRIVGADVIVAGDLRRSVG
jgi:3,4-dihydroxy 2-butanone 4-phosphate synthase/GTP cyclohydrolase II